nr:hypothetical protein [uncultured Dysosmobacter sp.]
MSRITDVKVKYSLVDITAAEDGQMSMPDAQPFSDLNELLDDEQIISRLSTMERNEWILDGTFQIFPVEMSSIFTGIWSQEQSNNDCIFEAPPVFTVNFSEPHTSGGITLVFSEATGDWCSNLTIQWFDQYGASMGTQTYQPDSARYFCSNQVEDYYKIQIAFNKTNKPNRFLKLTGIIYGITLDLDGSRLISCTVLEEVDPISSNLSVNTLNMSFHTEGGEFDLLDLTRAYVLFQQRQKADVTGWIDGVQMNMGSFYLETPSTTDNIVTVDCIDLVGTMDDTEYLGGYWPDGILSQDLIADIMSSAGIDEIQYSIDPSLQNITITGYLAIQSHREALQQVDFVIGAGVDCCRSEIINIRPLATSNPKVIPITRKVVSHTQELDPLVTGVEVFKHNYALGDTDGELFKETRQPGDYLIQFSSPSANLSATGATITESGVNYARITVATAGEVVISGRTYEDTQSLAGSVYMEHLPANAKPNVKAVTDCTLDADAQALAQRVYDYYQRRISDSGQIILSTEQAGDWIAMQNTNGKALVGTAEQISIDLTGGFIAAIDIRGTGMAT